MVSSLLCLNPHVSHPKERPEAPENLVVGILKTEEQNGQPESRIKNGKKENN